MSYRTLNTKPLNTTVKSLLKRGAHLGLGIGAFTPMLAMANPTGGQVAAGQATIATQGQNGMVITQTTAAAIINWQQFNIGAGQYVQFVQPSSSSIVLNRVIGGGSSSIFGSLSGNGQIFLINTNGVFFGNGASVDAQGFLASTLDISDSDFLARNFVFNKTGSDATVVNQGSITAHNGGYVVLAGDYTGNDGVIAAHAGHVVLASGSKGTLTLSGNSLVSFAVNQATLAQYVNGGDGKSHAASVSNTGSIIADGGTVVMTADVANALKATVVNNSGLVEAHGLTKTAGGIYLIGTGGDVENSGTLDANGADAATAGGDITLKADGNTILTSKSVIDTVGVGGAKGGSVELSGHNVAIRGQFNIGRGGNFLLDPASVEIKTGAGSHASTAGTIGTGFIDTTLGSGVNVTISAASKIYNSTSAHGITATGAGNLTLKIGDKGTIDLHGFDINIGGAFNTQIVGTHTHSGASGFSAATEKFGFIKAQSVDIEAGNDTSAHVVLHGASGSGTGLKQSVVTTGGNLFIHGHDVTTSAGTKGLYLSAGGSGADLEMNAKLTGYTNDVAIKSAGEAKLNRINTSGNILVKAEQIGYSGSNGSLQLEAGKNLTVQGEFASDATHHTLNAWLRLHAGSSNNIKVDHSITATGQVSFSGGHLIYTPNTGTFSVTAENAPLFDKATIGSANARAAYDVNFTAFGSNTNNVVVEKSIYTSKAISITGPNVYIVGVSGPVTLSADDGNAATTTDTVTVHATGSASQGHLLVQPGAAVAGFSGTANSVDRSVTLQAGQDVSLTGNHVDLAMGRAVARISGSNVAAVSAKSNLSITAGHNVVITAASNASIGASSSQFGGAQVTGDNKPTATATAANNVAITAGNNLSITATAGNVYVAGGHEQVYAQTGASGQAATATASGTVALKAGANIGITAGGSMSIHGGDGLTGSHSADYAYAGNSGAKAVAVSAADVGLKAGNAIVLTGHNAVTLDAGNRVAGASNTGSFSSNYQHGVYVGAAAAKASAGLTATSGLSLNAGAGGIAVTATTGGLNISGGNYVGAGLHASADGNSASVKVDLEAKAVLTTPGTVTLKGKTVAAFGGGSAIATGSRSSFHSGSTYHIHASADDYYANGTLAVTANTGVAITGAKGITMAGSGNFVDVEGGYSAARQMDIVKTGQNGNVTVNVDQSAALNAASGAITLTNSVGHIFLAGGRGNAESVGYNSGGPFPGFVASYGGTATLNTKSGLSIVAGGAFKASAANYVQFEAGQASDAAYTRMGAEHGATATMNVDASAALKAASVTFTGSRAYIGAGGNGGTASNGYSASVTAFDTAKASLTENNNLTITTPGAVSVTAKTGQLNIFGDSKNNLYSAYASAGEGGQAKVAVSGALTIAAGGAVSLKASHGSINVTAGRADGESAYVYASNDAKAAMIGNTGVTITAGGDFTASAGGDLFIGAGGNGAYGATVEAYHGSAAAGLAVNDNLAITANHVNLTASGAYLDISGGGEVASNAYAQGQDHGVAAIAATGTVTINATGGFKAKLGGSAVGGRINIAAGADAADSVAASASTHGKATIAADASTKISVTAGNIAITTGTRASSVSIGTHHYVVGPKVNLEAGLAAYNAYALGSSGVAAVSGKGNLTLSASGVINVSAPKGNLYIYAEEENAEYASASANGIGAKAGITAQDAVSIQAGGAISLVAGNNVDVYASGYGLSGAAANANSGGVAAINAVNNVNIVAGGAFTATAGGGLSITVAGDNGKNDNVNASNGATATLSDDASVAITATSIALSAGKSLDIYGGYSYTGYNADVYASNAAVAGLATKASVNLTATAGAFTAKAGGDLSIYGGYVYAGSAGTVEAYHHATATQTLDTSVNVKAATAITLNASGSMFLHAASDYLAEGDYVQGSDYGNATVNANGSVNFTAGTAFTAKLLGSGHGHDLEVYGASYAAYAATASGQNHGTATLNVNGTANINVTGSNGTITITTGAQSSDYVGILGHDYTGYSASANASHAGVATINANTGVTLTAKGNIAIKTGKNGDLSIYGGYADNAYNASASASGQGAAASVKVSDTINIRGNNVAISAGTFMTILGGYSYNGYHAYHHRGYVYSSICSCSTYQNGGAFANNGAKAGVSVDTSVNITAAGGFTAKASGMSILGNEYYGAEYASASAGRYAVAGYSEKGAVNITAGGAVTLTAATADIDIKGGYESNLEYNKVRATDHATAAVVGDQSVNIKAGGAFTATAASSMSIYAGYEDNAYGDSILANHGGKAGLAENGGINISGTSLTLTATAKTLEVYGGNDYDGYGASLDASNSAAANMNVKEGAALTATTGDVTFTAGKNLFVFGGYAAGTGATMSAYYHGKATETVDTSVAISGNHVNFTAGGSSLEIYGGSYAGESEYIQASNGGVANLTVTSGVNINAKSGFAANLTLASGASRHGKLLVYGGSYAGYSGTQYASNHGTVNEAADGSVTINAGTGNLTLKVSGAKLTGGTLSIYGGSEDAYSAYLSGTDGAVNTLTAKSGVTLAAAGNVTIAHNKGQVQVWGGSEAADSASAYAYGGAVTTITADSTVNVKAGGNIAIGAGTSMKLFAGDYTAYGAYASGQSGGVAKIAAANRTTFTAGGTFTAHALKEVQVYSAYEQAYSASAYAYTGGTAAITADGRLMIQAGGAISLTGGSGMSIYANESNAKSMYAYADSRGVAGIAANDTVSITAGGAVTLSGGAKQLKIYDSYYNGESASAYAYHGATAALTATEGVAIKGTSVALNAGTDMSIYGGYSDMEGFTAEASNGGVAKITGNAGISITATTGAVTMKALGNLQIDANYDVAYSGYMSASGAGAKAIVNANTSVNIAGQSVTMSAAKNLYISGGSDLAQSDSLAAYGGGVVTLNATAAVNITGATGVTAKLIGAGASHDLSIEGEYGVGYGILASASGGGIATATATGGVNIQATAAGAGVTLSVGPNQTNAAINVFDNYETAYGASAQAKTGGAATVNATDNVNITAPGAVTISGAHANLAIYTSGSAGYSASANANGPGTKATVNASQSVNIKAASITGSVGGFASIYAGYEYVGDYATAFAEDGGAAAIAINSTTNLIATGNISVTASGMSIYAAPNSVGYRAAVNASHDGAAATFSANASANIKAGGSVTLVTNGTTSGLTIYGGEYVGSDAGYNYGNKASDHASVKYTALGQVNITAGGNITAQTRRNLHIYNLSSAGWDARTTASGSAAKAATVADNSVTITAGGNVALKSGITSNISISVSDAAAEGAVVKAGPNDVAGETANSQITIKAGGNITAAAGAKLLVQGGTNAANGATITADGNGVAAVAANAYVSLTAGGSIGLSLQNGTASFLAGTGGYGAHVTADGYAAIGKLTTNASVSVVAGTALKVSGATTIKESGGNFPVSSHQVALSSSAGGTPTANLTQTVTLSGTSLSFNVTPTKHNGSNAVNAGGVTENGKVSNVTHAPASVNPSSFSPLSIRTTAELVRTAAMHLQLMPSTQAAPLATLQSDGIVVNLATVLSHPEVRALAGTDFTPGQGSSSHAGSSACQGTLVMGNGSYCSIR